MAQDISAEIDWNVLTAMLIETGWVKVTLSPMTSETSNEIDTWITDNVKDKHMARGLVWVFENEVEATMFALRWDG